MADANPFANLLQTPETLKAERQNRFDALNGPDSDFWVRMSGQSGLDLRNRLLEEGRGLNSQDRRALATQTILSNAQKSLAQYTQSGELDPMDAQELAVSQAMADFMAVGDYAAAQSLTPSLNGIRQYKAELGKLRSETTENVYDAEASRLKGLKDAGDTAATAAMLPSKIGASEAQARSYDASAAANLAAARLRDRTDPNIGSGGPGGGGQERKILPSRQAELTQGFAATMGVFDSLHELSLHYEQLPAVASRAGKGYNLAAQEVSGIYNFLSQRGSVEKDVASSLTEEQQAIAKRGIAERAANAKKMGMGSVVAYNSLVIDTAYAMARAMDPGGRLSNNDFAFALDALGAVQDAESAKAAFAAIAERAYKRYQATVKGEGTKEMQELFPGQMDAIEQSYGEFSKRWGRSNVREVDEAKSAPKIPCTPGRKKYGLC